jgi:uncharacterized caspase-like protein
MFKRFAGMVASLVVAIILISPAAAQKVALVIGNSDYKNAIALPNAVNDAADIGSVLSRIGFTVTTMTNANADDMRRAVTEFGDKAKGADVALIFFAGHAVEADGVHWSILVDGKVESLDDIKAQSVNLDQLLGSAAGSKLALVLIDTARDNPFPNKGVIQPAIRNTQSDVRNGLVFYSAKAGARPLDGEGRNSPFVVALLKHIETPGLDLPILARRVRDEVMAATQGKQEPFSYGSLPGGDIWLVPPR